MCSSARRSFFCYFSLLLSCDRVSGVNVPKGNFTHLHFYGVCYLIGSRLQLSRLEIDAAKKSKRIKNDFEWILVDTAYWYIYLLSNSDCFFFILILSLCWGAYRHTHTHSHFDMGIGVIYAMLITMYSNIISNWSFIIQIYKSVKQIWTLVACWLVVGYMYIFIYFFLCLFIFH